MRYIEEQTQYGENNNIISYKKREFISLQPRTKNLMGEKSDTKVRIDDKGHKFINKR